MQGPIRAVLLGVTALGMVLASLLIGWQFQDDLAQARAREAMVAKNLVPYDLEAIRAPTLIVGARDDLYGTYASTQYTASRIASAKFIGYDQGGHILVGHDEEIQQEILRWVVSRAEP